MTVEDIAKLSASGFTDWKSLGNVSVKASSDLLIFSYSSIISDWSDFELLSRGLIINKKTGEIVARPFDKFFNWGEKGRKPSPDAHLEYVMEKMDGCFRRDTPIQCWDGTTITIGEIVSKKLSPILMGVNKNGEVVPSKITNWFNNGTKNNWLSIVVDHPVSKKSGGGNHPNTIRVTSNHHLNINGQYKPAIEAKIGDEVLTFDYNLSNESLHIIRSGLLGDGCISLTHQSYRYQENHTLAQKEYTNEINKWFGDSVIESKETLSGYGSRMFWATTKTYIQLKSLRNEWYPDGIKVIPKDLSWIDDFTVAKWYMDDGSLSHTEFQQDRACFATNCFTRDDVQRLADKLTSMYNVSCTVYNSKGWALRVNAGKDNSIEVFWKAIAPHIVPVMRYKLPNEYRRISYVERKTYNSKIVTEKSKVLLINRLEVNKKNFPSGAVGFDIETETGNYFAKGTLVHNSLGILYRSNDSFKYRIATRGSFDSEQANFGTTFLCMPQFDLSNIDNKWTLLFEIIYPENRIVVDYGYKEDLVLLAARDRFTGEYATLTELNIIAHECHFNMANLHTFNNVTEIIENAARLSGNEEGYVVVFSDGTRWKIKGDRYLELHRLVSNISVKSTLEAMRGGQLDRYLESLPDEFANDIRRWSDLIKAKIAAIKLVVIGSFNEFDGNNLSMMARPEFARWVFANYPQYQSYFFAEYDGREWEHLIYKTEDWSFVE